MKRSNFYPKLILVSLLIFLLVPKILLWIFSNPSAELYFYFISTAIAFITFFISAVIYELNKSSKENLGPEKIDLINKKIKHPGSIGEFFALLILGFLILNLFVNLSVYLNEFNKIILLSIAIIFTLFTILSFSRNKAYSNVLFLINIFIFIITLFI